MARGHTRFPTRSVRRPVTWGLGPFGAFGAISASSSVVAPTLAQLVSDQTVIRIRGELLVYITTPGGAAAEGFRWAFGMGIINENAGGIGVTAMPTPITDIAWDGWMLYETGTILTPGTTTIDIEGSVCTAQRVPLDSKAMRKANATDIITAVLQVTETGDGTSMNAALQSRVLFKHE